jgi:hypothetical protein
MCLRMFRRKVKRSGNDARRLEEPRMSLRPRFIANILRTGIGVAAIAAIAVGTTAVNAGAATARPKCFWRIDAGAGDARPACGGSRTSTTAVLSSSLNPSSAGRPVTFSVTIRPDTGSATPTGSVIFSAIDPITLQVTQRASELLTGGAATWTSSTLPSGSDGVTVSYYGDDAFGKSSAALSEQVMPAASKPIVTSISPRKGAAAGGYAVTITGENFDSLTGVAIGTVNTVSFSCPTSTTCFVFMPAGTGRQHITLTNLAGTSTKGSADRFTYR